MVGGGADLRQVPCLLVPPMDYADRILFASLRTLQPSEIMRWTSSMKKNTWKYMRVGLSASTLIAALASCNSHLLL